MSRHGLTMRVVKKKRKLQVEVQIKKKIPYLSKLKQASNKSLFKINRTFKALIIKEKWNWKKFFKEFFKKLSYLFMWEN